MKIDPQDKKKTNPFDEQLGKKIQRKQKALHPLLCNTFGAFCVKEGIIYRTRQIFNSFLYIFILFFAIFRKSGTRTPKIFSVFGTKLLENA